MALKLYDSFINDKEIKIFVLIVLEEKGKIFHNMMINEFGKTHIPMKFTWEMTEKCNLDCKLCYSRDIASDRKKELSTEQSIKLINKLEEENVLYLFLDGGEPLMRYDFFQLLPLITDKFCTWLSTNGTLIDRRVARDLKKNHVNTVFVSLHGSNEKIHDSITQKSGAYRKTIEGIENLKSAGVRTMLSCQISKLNRDDIKEYVRICKFYNIEKINFLRPYPIGRGKENYEELALSAGEYERFAREIVNICDEYQVAYGHSFGYKNHNCCKQAFSCDSEGKLMNCPYLRFLPRIGDALAENLVDVWNSKISMEIRKLSDNIPTECVKCTNVDDCQGGCTAGRLLANRNGRDSICDCSNVKYVRNDYVKAGYPRVDLELGIKLFLYHTKTGKEYTLNSLSFLVWKILEEPKTENEICDFFYKAGMTEKRKILQEVQRICNLLLALDIISVDYGTDKYRFSKK